MNKYIISLLITAFLLMPGCAPPPEKQDDSSPPQLPKIEEITVDDYELFFGEDISEDLINEIENAGEIIRVGNYRFCTRNCRILKPLLDSLVKAKNRGVKVEIFLQRPDWPESGPTDYLVENNVSVYRYNQPDFQYHRFMIIDNRTVFFGSQKLTCTELSGRGYGLGMIAHQRPLAKKLNAYLDYHAESAQLLAPERKKWPLSIDEEKLNERQRKITLAIRKSLDGLTSTANFSDWWEYTSPAFRENLFAIIIGELEKSGEDGHSTAEILVELKNKSSINDPQIAEKITKLLKSFHPEIFKALQKIITDLQRNISDHLDDLVLKETDGYILIEPAWPFGPLFLFNETEETWKLAEIKWPETETDRNLRILHSGGKLIFHQKIDPDKLKTELNTKEPARHYNLSRVSASSGAARLTISRWRDNRISGSFYLPLLDNLPLPPGYGVEDNIRLKFDRWEDNNGSQHKDEIAALNSSHRRTHNRFSAAGLYGPTRKPPTGLTALHGNINIKFPRNLFKVHLDKKQTPENAEFDWGNIYEWNENQVSIQINNNFDKTLYHVSTKNKVDEYSSIYTHRRGDMIQIRSHRNEIDKLELFFADDYFEWEKDFRLPLSIYENSYTIEELREGVTAGDIEIKLEISPGEDKRLKLNFQFSNGIDRLLQWQPFSITDEPSGVPQTRTDHSNNRLTHYTDELPKYYKLRLATDPKK